MKKLTGILLAILLLLSLTATVFAAENVDSVGSMLEDLPTVEQFQAMNEEDRLEAYNRTQAAYDAYMALSEAERGQIPYGEETFEALFTYFNSQVMPVETAAAQEAPMAQKDRTATLLSGVATLAVVIVILRILNHKKR